MREIKIEEQIEAFNLAKSKQEVMDAVNRVRYEPVIENVEEEVS